jgi:hypothetical protein
VAGWDGAGISMLDSLNLNIINNTIISNDTTASAGVLFNTLGAPLASTQGPPCTSNCGTQSAIQPAGLVSLQNSAVFTANLPATVTCPAGHYSSASATNGNCRAFSVPLLFNDVFYQNRTFHISVGALGGGTLNQQNVVALLPTLNQATTGQCLGTYPTSGYWDIGVRGDTGPGNHASGITLPLMYSDVTAAYPGTGNITGNPSVTHQYCNGSRIPPEYALVCPAGTGCSAAGYQVPPGISDATVPNPIFNLTPAATVDEGNNWINLAWGPLSLTNPTVTGADGNYGGGPLLDGYSSYSTTTPPILNVGTGSASGVAAPTSDFFGSPRPQGSGFDMGAVELAGAITASASVSPTSPTFASTRTGTNSPNQTLTLTNSGAVGLTGIAVTVTAPFNRNGGSCTTTLAAGANCTIFVRFSPTASGPANGTVTITSNATVTGSPVTLTGTGVSRVAAAPTPRLTVTYPVGTVYPNSTATGTVTLTNTAAAGSASVTVTGVTLPAPGTLGNGSLTTRYFSIATNNCTGAAAVLAPGASCTVVLTFTEVALAPAGATINTSLTYTDNTGLAGQAEAVRGIAN